MTPIQKKNAIYFAAIALISSGTGFLSWYVFVLVAFVSGYLARKMQVTRYPSLFAAAATATGWILVALIRDIIESGRLSTKLAGFLSLPHASLMYLALFLLVGIPSWFAAYAGSDAYRAKSEPRSAE